MEDDIIDVEELGLVGDEEVQYVNDIMTEIGNLIIIENT